MSLLTYWSDGRPNARTLHRLGSESSATAAMHKGKDTSVTVMRLLRWLIVGAGLSLLALSISLHWNDARFDFGAPPAASPTASGGTIRVKQFGLEQTSPDKVSHPRRGAGRRGGKKNVGGGEETPPKKSGARGYSSPSFLRWGKISPGWGPSWGTLSRGGVFWGGARH